MISATGVIRWTPSEDQGPSANEFVTWVADDGVPALSATNRFTVGVSEVNRLPVLSVPADQVLDELTLLSVSASATDLDLPANTLEFGLVSSPAGMTIDNYSGQINWTPSEAQGPSTNLVTIRVSDDGVPSLSVTQSLSVVVREANSAPVLPVQTNLVVAELTEFVVTNTATDGDLPANGLTYQLLSAPTGAVISAQGLIRWTPTEDQGPSTNEFVTRVLDDGVPALSATNRFTVGVSEVHQGPEIITQPPSNTVASIGSEVRLEIVVTGTLPFSYQWQFQGEDLLNGTNCLLLLTNVQTAQAGCYRVQVSNHVGSLWSEDAWLAVRQPTIPRIIEGSVVRLENGSFEFSISSDVGSHLEIQGSENLENWTRLTTLTNVTGTVTFTDRSTPNRSRFYRAKQVQ